MIETKEAPRTAYVRLAISPTLLFCRRLIESALHDADQEWLMNDEFSPGTFRWCCHWLDQDPEIVRRQGLMNPCRRGKNPSLRLGGVQLTVSCAND